MSMSPNNPFDNNDPQAPQVQGPPPQGKSYKGCLIGCAVAGVLGVLICCGGGAMMVTVGTGAMAQEIQRQVEDEPAIQENIGEVSSFQFSWSGTIEESQKAAQDGGGESRIVFEVEGSKGSGKFIIEQGNAGQGSGVLVMDDGSRHEIDLSGIGNDMDDEDFDLELNEFVDEGEAESSETESEPAETE